MSARPYNFSAGPSALPDPVLRQIGDDLHNWRGTGCSVMEVSHRSDAFISLTHEIEADCRSLIGIPDDYHVLFCHGGARGQFSAIPMNLANNGVPAYIETGLWSAIAMEEAQRFTDVTCLASTKASDYATLPSEQSYDVSSKCSYLHYVDNETVHGVEFPAPISANCPIIADMSSNILSRPIDVRRFGMFYACAQKNLGIAGITMVVIHRDLLAKNPSISIPIPSILDYQQIHAKNSMPNTPSTFSWYVLGLVLKWVIQQGGLSVMDRNANERASALYDYIDQSSCFINQVAPHARSRMNVVFQLKNSELTESFIAESEVRGLTQLKGHRVKGGIRASLYNSMPMSGVKALINLMKDFEAKHHG